MDDLVDHIRGLEWKNEPLLVEFSADEEVQYNMLHSVVVHVLFWINEHVHDCDNVGIV